MYIYKYVYICVYIQQHLSSITGFNLSSIVETFPPNPPADEEKEEALAMRMEDWGGGNEGGGTLNEVRECSLA